MSDPKSFKIFEFAKVIGTLNSDLTPHRGNTITKIIPSHSGESPSSSSVSSSEDSDIHSDGDSSSKPKQRKVKITII